MREWITDPSKSQMDYDNMFRMNYNRNKSGASGIYMIEERHTDQRDFNFAANIAHTFRNQSVLRGGLTARINRTEYYDQVKDLLGADYWLDVDKFALRDNGNYNPLLSQNDLDYYLKHGEARRVGGRRQVQLRLLRQPAPGTGLGAVLRLVRRFHDEPRRRGRLYGHVARRPAAQGTLREQLAR